MGFLYTSAPNVMQTFKKLLTDPYAVIYQVWLNPNDPAAVQRLCVLVAIIVSAFITPLVWKCMDNWVDKQIKSDLKSAAKKVKSGSSPRSNIPCNIPPEHVEAFRLARKAKKRAGSVGARGRSKTPGAAKKAGRSKSTKSKGRKASKSSTRRA